MPLNDVRLPPSRSSTPPQFYEGDDVEVGVCHPSTSCNGYFKMACGTLSTLNYILPHLHTKLGKRVFFCVHVHVHGTLCW